MSKKIAVILGVGPSAGLGAAICRRAALHGCHVVVGGRTSEKIEAIADQIKLGGGSASPVTVDVTEETQIIDLFNQVDVIDGQLDFVSYNAGNSFSHDSLTMTAEFFERAWRVCCFGGFLTGREAGRRLCEFGRGSIIFTGATASVRSRPPFMAFAAGKAGLRAVAQAYARELGPQGVHVGHLIIDGGIDGERQHKRNPGILEKMGHNGLLKPDSIAESCWHLHQQHPSSWTQELDLRPFKEAF